MIEAVGVSEIAAESERRTQSMIDFASERGWTVNTPLETSQRGGTVMIGVDDAQATAERLATRKVFVDWRPGAGLRISPHFFNTDEEIEEALNILAELINQ
jgi:kynureninase